VFLKTLGWVYRCREQLGEVEEVPQWQVGGDFGVPVVMGDLAGAALQSLSFPV
jgi:hypothetical protein